MKKTLCILSLMSIAILSSAVSLASEGNHKKTSLSTQKAANAFLLDLFAAHKGPMVIDVQTFVDAKKKACELHGTQLTLSNDIMRKYINSFFINKMNTPENEPATPNDFNFDITPFFSKYQNGMPLIISDSHYNAHSLHASSPKIKKDSTQGLYDYDIDSHWEPLKDSDYWVQTLIKHYDNGLVGFGFRSMLRTFDLPAQKHLKYKHQSYEQPVGSPYIKPKIQ